MRSACLRLVALVGVIASGCAELGSEPTGPPLLDVIQLPVTPRTVRQEWRELAASNPGFGGLWMDGDTLVISATRSGTEQTMLQTAGAWLLMQKRLELLTRPHRIQKVPYDYAELDAVRRRISAVLVSDLRVNAFWTDPKAGRVMVGVDDEGAAREVQQALQSMNLPSGSHGVEITGPPRERSCSTLQSLCSPLVAGLQVLNVAANKYCSIGLVGWKNDSLQPSQPDLAYKVVISNAHCTTSQSQVLGDVIYQPDQSRAIGYEVDEAPVYSGSYCQQFGDPYVQCRWADVAVFRVYDSVSMAGGRTAVANSVKPPTVPTYITDAAYTGTGAIGAIVGESVARVGHVSGQKYGSVTSECVDRRAGASAPLLWTFCMHRASIVLRDGDSGGLVYVTTACCSTPPVPRPAGVSSQSDEPYFTPMYYSPMSLVLGSLGYEYFVAW